jgi:hypothetical protein
VSGSNFATYICGHQNTGSFYSNIGRLRMTYGTGTNVIKTLIPWYSLCFQRKIWNNYKWRTISNVSPESIFIKNLFLQHCYKIVSSKPAHKILFWETEIVYKTISVKCEKTQAIREMICLWFNFTLHLFLFMYFWHIFKWCVCVCASIHPYIVG